MSAFIHWLNRSRPGDRFIYHSGFLMIDRVNHVTVKGGMEFTMPREPVDSEGASAWEAMSSGLVRLVQEKLGPGVYDYIAVRRT